MGIAEEFLCRAVLIRPPKFCVMDRDIIYPQASDQSARVVIAFEPGASDPVPAQPPRLLDQLRARLRVLHYSIRTEQVYVDWARRFILFHGKRHPRDMGALEISAFLTDLTHDGNRLPRECGMHPRGRPRQPTTFELQDNGRGFPPNYLHESWRDYLYWDSELES